MAIQLQGDNISTVSSDLTVGGDLVVNGASTHAGGINVTGGSPQQDIYYASSNDSIRIGKALNARRHIAVSNASDPDNRLTLSTYSALKPSLVTNNSRPSQGQVGIQSYFSVASGETAVHISHFCAASYDNVQNLNVENYYGFVTSGIRTANKNYNFYSGGDISAGSTENYGFYSAGLGAASAGKNYHFYADGDAPSYFGGLTEHAGGVTLGDDKFISWGSGSPCIKYKSADSVLSATISSYPYPLLHASGDDSWNIGFLHSIIIYCIK